MKINRFKPKNLQAVNSLISKELKRKKSLFFKILKIFKKA